MVRHCVSCGNRCGPHHRPTTSLALLAEFHYYTAPKKGATAHWCSSCATLLDGFDDNLNKFYLMIVAGLWTTAQRLYPQWSASYDFPDRAEVDNYRRSRTFNLKHGAASYRLDRMSLQLYGSLPELYQDDKIGMLFCVVLARIAINQSEQFEEFVRQYQSCVGDLPRPASWNLNAAWEILKKFPFNMGYTARFLPQNCTRERGDSRLLGLNLASSFATHLHQFETFPTSMLHGNDATLKFLAHGLGLPQLKKALWLVVVARDWGVLFGEQVFQDSICDICGENGRRGLDQLLPKCGANRNLYTQAARLSKLTGWLDKRLRHDIPSILTGLGVNVTLQFTQHNLCEYMQQHHRISPTSKKWNSTRRPDGTLRNLWHKAAPLLLTQYEWNTWQPRLGDIFLTDTSLLLLLQTSFGQRTKDGWTADSVEQICQALRSKRRRH